MRAILVRIYINAGKLWLSILIAAREELMNEIHQLQQYFYQSLLLFYQEYISEPR